MVGMQFAIAAVPSFAFEADRRHELRPPRLLALDVGRVGLRRARDRLAAFEREPLSHFVGCEHRVELLVEPLDDRARRAGRRLSTTICWPSASASLSAMMRAMMVALPPGGNGTTSVIGRLGAGCAHAGAPQMAIAISAITATGAHR